MSAATQFLTMKSAFVRYKNLKIVDLCPFSDRYKHCDQWYYKSWLCTNNEWPSTCQFCLNHLRIFIWWSCKCVKCTRVTSRQLNEQFTRSNVWHFIRQIFVLHHNWIDRAQFRGIANIAIYVVIWEKEIVRSMSWQRFKKRLLLNIKY